MNNAYQGVNLAETDVELALLGSVFMSPETLAFVVDAIKPEWFADDFARYLFEASVRVHETGNRLTTPTILAALPEDCGGMKRGEVYARACAAAVPAASIGGLIHTLKDRWARRHLLELTDNAKTCATQFEADPYETVDQMIMGLDNISAIKADQAVKTIGGAVDSLFEDIRTENGLRGATTGLKSIDAKINGYKPGQLVVVAGRPGMGKSAFMCSSLRRSAQDGNGVLFFSLEMPAQEIAARMISDATDSPQGPFFGNILKGEIPDQFSQTVVDKARDLQNLPMQIEDGARITFAEIASKARKVKAVYEASGQSLAVVCIDHMGLVTPSNRYAGNKVAEAGEVSGRARELAKELNCCVVLLCQLSRDVEKREDKRPVMSDLRWSGEIEQDAHVIGFLYREAYYLAQDPDAAPERVQAARNSLEFLIRKNRNGDTSDVRLWSSIGHSMIRDL